MSGEMIVEKYRNKVEECLQGVKQELDLSFSRIDNLLDQLAIPTYPSVTQNIMFPTPKLIFISLSSLQNFAHSLIQQITPIIITNNQQNQLNQHQLVTQENHHQSNSKPFTYDLIHNRSIQYTEYCYAIVINQDNSIVLAGCQSKIKVFEFKQEQLKLIQLLSENQDNVAILKFMKKQTQFICGRDD